jgi:hypothetical protein
LGNTLRVLDALEVCTWVKMTGHRWIDQEMGHSQLSFLSESGGLYDVIVERRQDRTEVK